MVVRFVDSKQVSLAFSLALSVTLSLGGNPAWAGDPFRTKNPHKIGDKTEAAFEAIFRQGNYPQAKRYLLEAEKTEANEPLAYAMRASLAYADEDWGALNTYANKTLQTAQQLQPQDPLRGNLYVAVGYFLQGAYTFKQQDPIGAVNKLQQVFQYLDAAEKVAPDDPELNLLKGHLDLILSVNLPFSSPEEAIGRFEKYAAPDYMVNRALSSAYRDLKQYDKAISYMDKALKANPDNPELQYLKGQLLRTQGRKTQNVAMLREAFTYFEQALKKQDQLPKLVLISLRHDHNAVQNEIKELNANAGIK